MQAKNSQAPPIVFASNSLWEQTPFSAEKGVCSRRQRWTVFVQQKAAKDDKRDKRDNTSFSSREK